MNKTLTIGGDLTVNRVGFGAMRITGSGIFGMPEDRQKSIQVVRRAVELGVNFIDTADQYGPFTSEQLIAQALHPYPEDVVVATKGGLVRYGPGADLKNDATPQHLNDALDGSLRRLKRDRIDLYQLHRIDPDIPVEATFRSLARGAGRRPGSAPRTVGGERRRDQGSAAVLRGHHGAEPLQPGQPHGRTGARLLP